MQLQDPKKVPIFQLLPGPPQFLKQQGLTLQHNPQKTTGGREEVQFILQRAGLDQFLKASDLTDPQYSLSL